MKFPWSRHKEIAEEVRGHLQMAIQERIERGEAPEQAEREARREFGNEMLIRQTARDMWGWVNLEAFARDLLYVLRQLRRNPGFTAVAVVTLTLGFGANTAIFSIIDSVLLGPLHYRDPCRLYSIVNVPPPSALSNRYWYNNARHFNEWREHCRSCEDIAIAEAVGFNITGVGEPERLPGLRVSYNFFRTLGTQPRLGRDFRPEEELPGQFHEVILTDAAWRSKFSTDPDIIGRTVQINGEAFFIIGVLPPEFRLPVGDQWGPGSGTTPQPLIFRPLGQDVSRVRPAGNYNFIGIVRLKPGIGVSHAVAELNAQIETFVREFKIELRPALLPLQDAVTRGARGQLWLLMSAVTALWLIVCINVGNLMLVRTASRDREAGIRMALGSGAAHLFTLVLLEALVLVSIGSSLGSLLASGLVKAFRLWAPPGLPRIDDIHMGWHVAWFAIAATTVCIAIYGLFPAWRLARTDPYESLKAGSAVSTAPRRKVSLRELMVGVEVGLSTILLIIGSLLMLSFFRVINVPRGFETAQVIAQDVSLANAKYRDADQIRFVDDALVKLAAIPGVRSVGVTNQLPLRGETWTCDLRDAGANKAEIGIANFRFVSPGYWTTLGIPLKKGRLLQPTDRTRAVAVVSERAAEALWPGQDPIGRHVGNCGPDGSEVIGVVTEVRASLEQNPPFTVYLPYWKMPLSRPYFVLRTQVQPTAITESIRAALQAIDPELAISQPATMDQVFGESITVRRFQLNLTAAFAVSAVLLAALGIYGVVSFTVARRTSELGIRSALGARVVDLRRMVLRQAMTPVVLGLAAGLVCALLVGRFIKSQLYEVAPTEPVALFVVVVVLLIVGGFACWIPAQRALRIDPLRALRFE